MSVDTDVDASTDLFGLSVTDLQEGIAINGSEITGTLKYVDDYSSAFSGAEASGNYLALHITVPGLDPEDYTITVTVTNPVTLDSDGIVVLRIADKSSQTITVVASADGYDPITKVFSLTGLTCETEA